MPKQDTPTMFGAWMRRERRRKGLTIQQVAEAIEYSITHISDVERGRRSPNAEIAMQFADVAGIDRDIALRQIGFPKRVRVPRRRRPAPTPE